MSALAKIKVFREHLFLAGPWNKRAYYHHVEMDSEYTKTNIRALRVGVYIFSYLESNMTIFKYIQAILITILIFLALSNVSVAQPAIGKLEVNKGDLISQKNENGDWSVVKVLEVDKWPDGTYTAHCLTFKPTKQKPKMSNIESLDVFSFHAPIDAASFSTGWNLIGNSIPKNSELVSFTEYLRLTDFQRYAKITNQDVNSLVSEANAYYKSAISAGEKGDHREAISLYSKAINLFPLFYEAIDNRAFTYMDTGEYSKAMSDFNQSLQVNPNGLSAFFSIGECLLKLGKYTEAMEVFKEGAVKFPEKNPLFKKFYNKAEALSKNG
ncbi:MAG: tetratricopeptide repeat protein [Sneathiella sp.]|nr:tetratricopeptide repeat protein [Sneathiella sp.]